MSLAPELAAFIGRPPASKHPEAKAVHGYAGLAHHGATSGRVTEPSEAQENPMPTGVYPRKKKAQKLSVSGLSKAERRARLDAVLAEEQAAEVKPKAAQKVRAKATTKPRPAGPRFGVFEDGTVELRLASCAGIIAPTEAREFLAFLKRIGVE